MHNLIVSRLLQRQNDLVLAQQQHSVEYGRGDTMMFITVFENIV